MNIHNIVECHDGWKGLYQPIVDRIIQHDLEKDDMTEKIGVSRVREKLGCLNIEVINKNNLTISIAKDIRSSQIESEGVCEFCGTTERVGHTTIDTWRKSCCNACWKAHILPYQPRSRWLDDSATTAKYIKNVLSI